MEQARNAILIAPFIMISDVLTCNKRLDRGEALQAMTATDLFDVIRVVHFNALQQLRSVSIARKWLLFQNVIIRLSQKPKDQTKVS